MEKPNKIFKIIEENYTRMECVDAQNIENDYTLGTDDAVQEWNSDWRVAKKKFLHIDAYQRFLDVNSLILLGRTGSGKTAILKCIESEIKNGGGAKGFIYNHVICIQTDSIISELAKFCDKLSVNKMDTMVSARNFIDKFIKIRIMEYVFENFDIPLKTDLGKFLQDSGLIRKPNKEALYECLRKAGKTLSNFIPDSKISSVIVDTVSLIKSAHAAFDSPAEFLNAEEELLLIIKEFDIKILVLLDSFDEYMLNEESVLVATKALILSCFDFHDVQVKNGIYFKIAFPSEVHSKILSVLPGKVGGNTVVINWKYGQLIRVWHFVFFHGTAN